MKKERQAKMEEQQTNTEEVIDATTTEMIVSESTSCTYPTDSSNGEDVLHITWYTEEGIYCRKAGQTEGYEWSISFENKEQYNKVMEFIGQLPMDLPGAVSRDIFPQLESLRQVGTGPLLGVAFAFIVPAILSAAAVLV